MLDSGLLTRFRASFVEGLEDECWEWLRSRHVAGYGQLKITSERRQAYSHRIAFEVAYGPIPPGKQVCHTCDNPPCVNPHHLFVGTSGDNHQDMKRKNRHLFGERNVRAVLTEQKAREIVALSPLLSQRELAKRYGVSQGTISKIALGRRWAHLRKG